MGVYTITVREIIEETYEELNPGQTIDMHDDDAVIATAKVCIFDRAVERIKPEYRDVFVLGFARMFANREIGVSDEDLFVFNVGADIITNADYINAMYDAAAIGLFGARTEAENKATRLSSEESTQTTTDSDNRVVDFTTDRDTIENGTGTSKNTDSGTDVVDVDDKISRDSDRTSLIVTSGSDTVGTTEGITRANKRTSTITTSGSDKDTRSLSTAVDGETGDVVTNSGTDTTEYGRKDQRSGAVSDNYGAGLIVANSGKLKTTGNSLTTFPVARTTTTNSETRNILNEGPDNAMAGIDNDDYMSSATKNLQNTTSTEAGSENVATSQENEDNTRSTTTGIVTHGDDTATTASGEDKNIHGHVITTTGTTGTTTTDSGDIITLYGKVDTTVENEEGTETRESDSTTTYGKQDNNTEHEKGNENRLGKTSTEYGKVSDGLTTDKKIGALTGADKTTDAGTRNGVVEGTGNGSVNDAGTSKANALDYKEIMRYGSLLDGVWVLFRFNFFSLF